MTQKEQQLFDMVSNTLKDLKKENETFKNLISGQVEKIESKVDKKHVPINYETEILRVAQSAILDSIVKSLTEYNSPMKQIIDVVISENSNNLKAIISDSFTQVIEKDEFKKSVVNAFSHKISRSIISNSEGLFDKVSNELKQDSKFKAKITLAIANIVEECLLENKNSRK